MRIHRFSNVEENYSKGEDGEVARQPRLRDCLADLRARHLTGDHSVEDMEWVGACGVTALVGTLLRAKDLLKRKSSLMSSLTIVSQVM